MADNLLNTIDPEKYKKALASVQKMSDKTKDMNKNLATQKSIIDGIASSIFKVSSSDFFKEIPKSMKDLDRDYEKIRKIEMALKGAANDLGNMFKNSKLGESAKEVAKKMQDAFDNRIDIVGINFREAFNLQGATKGMEDEFNALVKNVKKLGKEGNDVESAFKNLSKDLKENKPLLDKMRELHNSEKIFFEQTGEATKELSGDLLFLNDVQDKHLKTKILEKLASGDIAGLIEEEGDAAIQILMTSKNLSSEQKKMLLTYKQQSVAAKETKDILAKTTKEVFSLGKGMKAIFMDIAKGIVPKMLEFDSAIHDAQQESGIMFTQNSAAMTDLSVKTAEFGMSIAETVEMMSSLSKELKTTDFNVLSKAADDLKAIQLATGMSGENLGIMAGEMMRNGQSSEQVRDAMTDANVMAKRFGVSSKSVLDGMAKNITKMRTMGFTGGEASLMKMVATAERLRMNVDEIFDVAKKARSIEGAMEMAAQLQLAGGSFANINPMQLLSAARKGPAELQKILTSMGGDVGRFVTDMKGNKKFQFDPVDVDRLQIVADATGQSLDSIQQMIQKNAENNQKIQFMPDITFDGLKDAEGNPIDPDSIKNTLMDSVDMTGKVLKGSVLDEAGIKDLGSITKEQAQKLMQDQLKKDKNLEEQAKQNQSLQKSFKAFTDVLQNMMTKFQPIIDGLTKAIQWLIQNKWAMFVIGIIALAAKLPMLISSMGGMAGSLKSWGTSFSSMFSKGGAAGLFKKGAGIPSFDAKTGRDAAEKLSLVKKVPSLPPVASGAGKGIGGLSGSVSAASRSQIDMKGITKLVLAIALLSVVLVGLAIVFTKMGGDPLALVALGFAIIEIATALWIVSKMGKGIQIGGMVQLGIGMAIIGLAMIPFAFAASLMTGVDWVSVLIGVGLLTLIVLGLGLLGTFLLLLMPGLILMGLGMLLVSASLFLFGKSIIPLTEGLKVLATVPWDSFNGMFGALVKVAGGLMAFGLAGLMFVNPFMMIGMLAMIGTLMMVSAVLTPLALALDMGSKGIDGMAQGVLKLSDSLAKLDFEKLDKLKEFSADMADASSGTAMVEAIGKLAEAMGNVGGGKSGGAGESKQIVVQLVLPNGGVLQQAICEYNAKAS